MILLRYLTYCCLGGARVCLFVLFRLLLIAFALIEAGKFTSVYDYTRKISSSLAIFHHVGYLFCC